MVKRIRSRGYYPYITNPEELQYLETRPDEVHKIFVDQVLQRGPAVDGPGRQKTGGDGHEGILLAGQR